MRDEHSTPRLSLERAAKPPVIACGRCQRDVEPVLTWHPTSNGRVHLRATCPRCKRWIAWLPQTQPWLSLVLTKPNPRSSGGEIFH